MGERTKSIGLKGIIASIFVSFVVALACMSMPVNAADMADYDIPEYNNKPYTELNDNEPEFTDRMITAAQNKTYETYTTLDKLGRCSVCIASIDQTLMPTEEREAIGSVKPSGWQTVKYSDQIEGNYLYNRCHLIGYQLTGENDNRKNLITGTRYLNVDGMLPFENKVASYINKNANNKVLYRVTPVYDGDNLVASGVKIEALSLNDKGKSICFNVYCYNVQPGIDIDYETGKSSLSANWKEDIKGIKAESVKSTSASVATTTSKTEKSSTAKNTGEQAKQQEQQKPAEQNTQEQVQQVVEQEPAQQSASTGNDTVAWLSATGECYHSINDCGRMNPNKARQTTVSQAEASGYRRCSKCW